MHCYNYTIDPIAKGRPRFNGKWAYTPKSTRENALEIATLTISQADGKKPLEGPLKLNVTFFLKAPKRPKHKKYPIVRPDIDNYLKQYLDAVQGIIFKDDSQIVHVECIKEYATSGSIKAVFYELK